ncbi:hypothetical protein [Escherichia coli]|uniref:hypothetical protein n=1 Tax=Escherichia coli TaxID=562 RepID=UPI000CFDA38E|nr:hypothetical protein [Escherichia coli]
MEVFKGTPGPWQWWTSNSFVRLTSLETGKDGGVIDSYVMPDGHSSIIVSEEDMKLIAAAPVLLDALQCVLEYGSITGDDWVVEKVENAIKKALKGEAL